MYKKNRNKKKKTTDNTGKAKTIVFQTLRSISVALIHNGNLLQDLQWVIPHLIL